MVLIECMCVWRGYNQIIYDFYYRVSSLWEHLGPQECLFSECCPGFEPCRYAEFDYQDVSLPYVLFILLQIAQEDKIDLFAHLYYQEFII